MEKRRVTLKKRTRKISGGNSYNKYKLLHSTHIDSLLQIFDSKCLKSADELGIEGTHGEHNNYIYMTLTDGNEKLPIPFFGHANTCVLHFNFEKLIEDYPNYFINEGNSFGPLNGRNLRKNARLPQCYCSRTYTNKTRSRTRSNNGKKMGPCAKESLDAILKELVFDLEHCDGGPEIGFKTNKIPLNDYLDYVTINKKLYDANKVELEKYSKKYEILVKN